MTFISCLLLLHYQHVDTSLAVNQSNNVHAPDWSGDVAT